MEHSRNECANFRRLSGFASYFPETPPCADAHSVGTYRHEPKSQRESVMKTTLIVIQNDADHADAKKLMGSSDSQDQARMVAQARLVEAYECTQWPRTAPTLQFFSPT